MKKIQLVIILLLTIYGNEVQAFDHYRGYNNYYSGGLQHQQQYVQSQHYNKYAPLPWGNNQNNQNCEDDRRRPFGYSAPTINHYHNYYPPNYKHYKHGKRKYYNYGRNHYNRMIYPSNYRQNVPLYSDGNINIQIGF